MHRPANLSLISIVDNCLPYFCAELRPCSFGLVCGCAGCVCLLIANRDGLNSFFLACLLVSQMSVVLCCVTEDEQLTATLCST